MIMWRIISRELIEALEKSGIRELADVLSDTKKLVYRSFVSGLFRGLGAAIGFSVLGAIALLLLSRIFGTEF